ncbi:L-2-amino-thiazoline-4-carboxylic acid hydrolase [Butyrivibrio fibrisolvens]|uniref:L-2-amino-thiazoline-4-carboxylic acid hydrolase n=1 Tax=Butyrivibrio fibrisolvens TaxID=831 RepID=UPI001FA92D7F|nr:L-2-amino-thiazoline-4-carboxylic acid hydrolase [Butyrivibrio fibrisolvens]
MMKYKGTYLRLFSLMLKKYLKEQYGLEVTRKALKGSKAVYRTMLEKVDDIGSDNPMAKNIYMCFVFLAIWDAADGAIDVESFGTVIKRFMKSPMVSKIMSGSDLNRLEDMQKAKDKFHAMQAWADAHPQYKDKTWDFNFDETKHKDGSYYHFTRCPLEKFARENGYLEVLPVCCEIDYLLTEASMACFIEIIH